MRRRKRHQAAGGEAGPQSRARRIKHASADITASVASALAASSTQAAVWENAIANQISHPSQIFRAQTLADLVAIVKQAESDGKRVRAIGSGHSFSNVGMVGDGDLLVNTHDMNDPLDLPPLRDNAPVLYRAEAGITVADLLETLDEVGLGIQNMGNYSGQTLAGALSTGTHGSGASTGPMASQIRSLVLVASGGRVFRIEPSNGITDPVAFEREQSAAPSETVMTLVQDDHWFRAVAVSMGCMGLIYSITLQVRAQYWLHEVRTVENWSSMRLQLDAEFSRIQAGEPMQLLSPRHFELLLSPHQVKAEHSVLVTRREVGDPVENPTYDQAHRNFKGKLMSILPGSGKGVVWLTNHFPRLLAGIVDANIRGRADETYINVSYKVLRDQDSGFELLDDLSDNLKGYSSSMCFPIDRAVEAIDHILARKGLGADALISGPIKIRFVKSTDLYMAVQNDPNFGVVCMVEPMMLFGTKGKFAYMTWILETTLRFGGRPHWGLNFNYLSDTGILDKLQRSYPHLAEWIDVYRQLNPDGTFDNAFTERNKLRESNIR